MEKTWFSQNWLRQIALTSDDVAKVHGLDIPMTMCLDQAVKCNRMLAAYDALLRAIDAGAVYPEGTESGMLGALLSAIAGYRAKIGGPEGWLMPETRRITR
jgi:hypothetical protein